MGREQSYGDRQEEEMAPRGGGRGGRRGGRGGRGVRGGRGRRGGFVARGRGRGRGRGGGDDGGEERRPPPYNARFGKVN